MKVAILGTRGIPNAYGGFEQLAEYLAVALVQRGHEVYVYCSSLHPYKNSGYKGVQLLHCNDAENRLGTFGQFIYDFNCIRDARRRNFEVILQLGYTSSSVWAFMLPKQPVIITNMDGLEWKRSKYSRPVQQFLKKAEAWAVKSSDMLVADSPAIQSYLADKYDIASTFIPYGADIFEPSGTGILPFGLQPYGYYLAIARFEPENNLEAIISGYLQSGKKEPLVLIGAYQNAYGQQLYQRYHSGKIIFAGSLYQPDPLNLLRFYSKLYFHGHSVGGTNPSLLEAMAAQALICAHDNEFNRAVLGSDAAYFTQDDDISRLLNMLPGQDIRAQWCTRNLGKIRAVYRWTGVIDAYEQLMQQAIAI